MIARLWNRWNPQPTWQEFVRLTLIESATAFALICLLNAIF
jgi:hypothetical protein